MIGIQSNAQNSRSIALCYYVLFVALNTLAYMGVGRSTKIMNYKFFSMNVSNFLKKMTPAVVLFVVILGALNIGSYDPYNELTVLTPDMAMAQLVVPGLTTPSFGTPTLSAPTLTQPTIEVPEVVEPVLEVPSITTPELAAPEVTTPALTVPTFTTPTLTNPTLTAPSLTVPGITIPALSGSSSSQSSSYTNTFRTCNFYATTATTVTAGSSITLEWSTSGYSKVTINGETVNNSGSISSTGTVSINLKELL